MSIQFTIRHRLEPGDIGYVIYLHGILYAQSHGWNASFEAHVAEPMARFVKNGNRAERMWIVEFEERVCGSLALTRIDQARAQLRWFLLDPALRGQGVGNVLMDRLLEFARQKEYRSIELWTVKGLEVAAAVYSKYGFKLTEELTSRTWGATVTEQKYLLKL